jgi:hypothetical protein
MVSKIDSKGFQTFRGLSTEEKPIDAENGSSFYEMDTGLWYYKSGTIWIKKK